MSLDAHPPQSVLRQLPRRSCRAAPCLPSALGLAFQLSNGFLTARKAPTRRHLACPRTPLYIKGPVKPRHRSTDSRFPTHRPCPSGP